MQNHKGFLLTGFLLLFSIISFSQVIPRQRINFDNDWKFHLGHTSNPEKDFNYGITKVFVKSGSAENSAIEARFKDSTWAKINLPHDWAVELPFAKSEDLNVEAHGFKPVGGLFPETSVGWYRKHFKVAPSDSGSRFQIQFDGIFRDANIWINGFYLGNNKSGYLGVAYDITDFINFKRENVIVVRADASQYEGWFYEGAGIYRHVWLNKYSNLHINTDGIFAHAKIQDNKATIYVETNVSNENFSPTNYTLTSYLIDRSGKMIGKSIDQPLSQPSLEEKTTKQSFTITNPHLWTLEDPYLHRVVVELKANGQIIDKQSFKFGIRTIEVKNNGVFLNGKYVKILGTNNHQDHAGIGSALPDYLQYYRISLLKNMGSNAYRTSHHAPTPELLEACDSLGMLVMDEQRLLNSGAEYMAQFERLLKRDRNHASVFMWSIGNEEGGIQTNTFGKRIALSLIEKQKQLDPTRTSTYAADLANVYRGVNEVIPVRGFNYRQFAVADYHKDHPTQPILGTEMGSTVTTRGIYETDSIRGYLPDQDITAPWWASKAEEWWKLSATNDFWLGGFIWTGFDYRGEPTPFRWPNVNSHFGVMDVCGFPKNIYYYYQSWWTDKDILHISPHWNWLGKNDKPIDVWVNSNADNVELFLNGKSLGKKDMPRNGHLQWSVNYAPGKLEAIAYKNSKQLTAKIETTGRPTEVVVTPYKTTTLADGQDVSIINISVVDKEGREVPDADNMIRFSLKGDAKIIGVGNGDPSSHEPDKCIDGAWQRALFNGKCQVIVQAGTKPDLIKFEATATGLFTGSTDIVTVAPEKAAKITIDKTYELKGEAAKNRSVDKMIGADISFLPELEARNVKFSDNGVEKDAIQILKEHGFNYIRLRIFNNPANANGYSPNKGFCDLEHTKLMAKRVKAAGLKLLLDFHYSDYWADPGKQNKPVAWNSLQFTEIKKSLFDYTKQVMQELKDQGTVPDMVQIGNEINHGIVWPDGNVQNPDELAQLLNAGTAAVKAVDANVVMMLHVALGGQNHESVNFIDGMLARGVHFDVIGESYYPKWHGTTDDLRDNLSNLIQRYNKDVIVVEYSQLKEDVNAIAFNLPNGRGKGTCIWEPLNTWESIFQKDGKSNQLLGVYDKLSRQFLIK
ncbi:beta-galactosidase GalA [Arcicella aquatica]|uniref:Arabinogalactan endo-beta-1,4-galactanase n=1 Tax=Arcicella aquatica TaxID=217141 RepID=A0ABU5QRF8_9BACT|nr:beta-galactosidase GalA [Arcicella aquatica]MEA5259680.1 beta-galactosidase GalA [Arcicella aquatica]